MQIFKTREPMEAAGLGAGSHGVSVDGEQVKIKEVKQEPGEKKKTEKNSSNASGDRLEISVRGLEMYQQMIEQMNENREEQEKAIEDEAKIMEIFRRIASGDEVPPIDEKKLQEYNSEMYQAAKLAGSLAKNDEKKEYDALFKDEEQGDEQKSTKQQIAESGSVNIAAAEGPSFSFH